MPRNPERREGPRLAVEPVALVPGSLAGAWGYRRKMKRARRWLYLLVGPSLAGGVIGAAPAS